ncbi:MAG: radical SAM protein [archaeon]
MFEKLKQHLSSRYRDAFVFHLNVEISAQCNLNCRICGFQRYYKPKGLMGMETFKRLEDAFKKADSVLFGFNAETLLNKQVIEMLAFAKKANPKLRASILTNGSLLTPELSEQLIVNGLDDLSISIDGATKKTHESIRKGSDFDKLISSIRTLNELKENYKSNTPFLSTNYVGTKDNINELLAFIDLAKELKFGSVRLTNIEPYTDEMQSKILYGDSYDESISETIDKAKKKCEELGIQFSYPEFKKDDAVKCEFMQPIITWQGDVIPCSQFTYERDTLYYGKRVFHPVISFGNINDKSFEDIWNSKAYRKFRKDVAKGKGPDFCYRSCLLREKVLCPK